MLTNIHAQQKGPVVIGSIIPLSGAVALEGLDMKRGMTLAVEEVNATGGVLGRPLKIIWEDTKLNPATGLNYARKLAEIDKVPLILGEYSPAVSLYTGKYTDRRKIIQITIGLATLKFSKIGPYFFNVMGLAEDIATDLGEFALKDSAAKKVGFLTVENPFGLEMEKRIKKIVKKTSVSLVSTIRYKISKKDYHAEIQKLFQPKPQIVIFTPIGEEARIILQQASELGFKEKIGWYSSYVDMWANYVIPETAEGIKGLAIGVRGKLYGQYASKYEKKFGVKPSEAPPQTDELCL